MKKNTISSNNPTRSKYKFSREFVVFPNGDDYDLYYLNNGRVKKINRFIDCRSLNDSLICDFENTKQFTISFISDYCASKKSLFKFINWSSLVSTSKTRLAFSQFNKEYTPKTTKVVAKSIDILPFEWSDSGYHMFYKIKYIN